MLLKMLINYYFTLRSIYIVQIQFRHSYANKTKNQNL